jgi:hypothetical protein
MRQSRMSRRAEERDHLMLQLLLLTEKELTAVLGMGTAGRRQGWPSKDRQRARDRTAESAHFNR